MYQSENGVEIKISGSWKMIFFHYLLLQESFPFPPMKTEDGLILDITEQYPRDFNSYLVLQSFMDTLPVLFFNVWLPRALKTDVINF